MAAQEGEGLFFYNDEDDQEQCEDESSHQPMMMSQDCVAWDEGKQKPNLPLQTTTTGSGKSTSTKTSFSASRPNVSVGRNMNEFGVHASSRPSKDQLKLKPTQKNQDDKQNGNNPDREIESIFCLLRPNSKQRVLPPENQPPKVNSQANEESTADNFPRPLQRKPLNQKNVNNRHSYPPTSTGPKKEISRKRPSFGTCMPSKVSHGKLARTSISPVPHVQGQKKKAQQSTALEQTSGFANLLNQVETPSPEGEISSNGKRQGVTTTQVTTISEENKKASGNTRVQASMNALNIKPTALLDQAFLPAKQNKENMDLVTQNQRPQSVSKPREPKKASSCGSKKSPQQHALPTQDASTTGPSPTTVTFRNDATGSCFPPLASAPSSIDEFGDDEFGDFQLSEEDFANVDTLVAATQQMVDAPFRHEKDPPLPNRDEGLPTTTSQSSTVKPSPEECISAIATTAKVKVATNSSPLGNDNEEFGDDFFGDIDFDALDAAVATQTQPRFSNSTQAEVIRNKRSGTYNDDTSYLSFTRYKIQSVELNCSVWTKTLALILWDSSMFDDYDKRQALHKPSSRGQKCKETTECTAAELSVGLLVLRGSWYYLDVEEGDVLHVVSLTGRFETGPCALPIVIHSDAPVGSDFDDLVPIVHPEMLAIPTTATETLDCERRAVLKHRLGSTVSTSKALLLGTLRHSLFEVTLKENLTMDQARYHIRNILRKESEKLVCCRMTTAQGEQELLKFLPQVQAFKRAHFATPENGHRLATLNGMAQQPETEFAVAAVTGVEEEVTSPELGLKGNLDVLVEALTRPINSSRTDEFHSDTTKSLMSIELKTHHRANPKPAHFAQLAYYTAMLLSRQGHTASDILAKNPRAYDAVAASMLLYINNEEQKPLYVAPSLNDIKTLVDQRNKLCSQTAQASRPRGVELTYDDEGGPPKILISKEAPPALLPGLNPASQCSRCYSARECMLYAASDAPQTAGARKDDARKTHGEVLGQYTGLLGERELDYFKSWDRLIDLEADATQHSVAEAWLEQSSAREMRTARCISSLVYTSGESSKEGSTDSYALVGFSRAETASLRTPFSSLQVQQGSYITCSTDSTTLEISSVRHGSVKRSSQRKHHRRFRHQMKVFRGTVERIEGDDVIIVRAAPETIHKIEDLLDRFQNSNKNGTEKLHFRVDVDDSYSLMGTLRRNLVDLLTKDRVKSDETAGQPDLRSVMLQKRFSRHRELIIRLERPVYNEDQQKNMFNPPPNARPVPGCDPMDLAMDFSKMNGDQRAAAEKVAAMQDYTLIQGYPGSGKTSTIVFVVRMLVALGKRVLITSYTHSAVDNCLLKLIEHGVGERIGENRPPSILRIGNISSVHPGVQPLLVSRVASELEAGHPTREGDTSPPSAESIRRVLKSARIVGATALKIPKSILVGEHFDVVIVDEAGQIGQPATLGALAAADRFVLVGDQKQLPPLVKSEAALEGGYGNSMLMRLAESHPDVVAQLTLQYRMNKDIASLSSRAIYDGKLRCAEEVSRLDLPGFPRALSAFGKTNQWMKAVLNPYRPTVFADTDGLVSKVGAGQEGMEPLERTASRQTGGVVNEREAQIVSLLVQGLSSCGLHPSSIGVICPFNAQIKLLEDCPQIQNLKREGLEVNTIDKYQGRDKDAIIVSFVRSNRKGKVGRLLEDARRINVAITRARQKMVLVGSFSTLTGGSPTLKSILNQLQEEKRLVSLPPGAVPANSRSFT